MEDVHDAVLRFSRGILYRTDAHGNLNIAFGRSDLPLQTLEENLFALLENVLQHNMGSRGMLCVCVCVVRMCVCVCACVRVRVCP